MTKENKKIILVCEDEDALSLPLKENLIREGFDVLTAKDGEEGLVLAIKEKPDLILLDILMPKMDGMAMMKKVRENEWGKKVPIILMTVLPLDEKITQGIVEDHPDYYMIKADWSIIEIIKKIRHIISQKVPGF
jgi:DNA-binding response OmpR family regulator